MILVTGGAGYIGSHTVKLLKDNFFDIIILDNLSTGHKEFIQNCNFINCDLSNKLLLNDIFKQYKIDTVIHFAASAYVGESVLSPDLYYRNNICNGLNLLDCMKENNVSNIIFSSSCATYGIPNNLPLTEGHPQNPISPYGMTKYVFERILSDYSKAFGINYVCLRYFNAAGADSDCEIGEWHIPETHVIPLMIESAYKQTQFSVFGDDYKTKDGSCIRDYIHVADLAYAHMKAIDYLSKSNHENHINLGTGEGISVFDLIKTVERVTCKTIHVNLCKKREGDPAELVSSYKLAEKELDWKPVYSSIENIVNSACNWYKKLSNYIILK
jgi:UDP-glucose 4-epimerase